MIESWREERRKKEKRELNRRDRGEGRTKVGEGREEPSVAEERRRLGRLVRFGSSLGPLGWCHDSPTPTTSSSSFASANIHRATRFRGMHGQIWLRQPCVTLFQPALFGSAGPHPLMLLAAGVDAVSTSGLLFSPFGQAPEPKSKTLESKSFLDSIRYDAHYVLKTPPWIQITETRVRPIPHHSLDCYSVCALWAERTSISTWTSSGSRKKSREQETERSTIKTRPPSSKNPFRICSSAAGRAGSRRHGQARVRGRRLDESARRGDRKGWMILPPLLLQDTCQPIPFQQSCGQKTLPPTGAGAVGRWARMRGFGHHTFPRAPLSDWLCQHDDSNGSESQQSSMKKIFRCT